jgi:hypothetical protein
MVPDHVRAGDQHSGRDEEPVAARRPGPDGGAHVEQLGRLVVAHGRPFIASAREGRGSVADPHPSLSSPDPQACSFTSGIDAPLKGGAATYLVRPTVDGSPPGRRGLQMDDHGDPDNADQRSSWERIKQLSVFWEKPMIM